MLRADGFPRHTVFTLAASLENRILDSVRQDVAKAADVVRERRFVRTRDGREFDALLESSTRTFAVEVKILRQAVALDALDRWVSQLTSLAGALKIDSVECILALGCVGSGVADATRGQLARLTVDSAAAPVRILVYDDAHLASGESDVVS